MTTPPTDNQASYELALPTADGQPPWAADPRASTDLPESILLHNVLWFCRLRWIAVGVFVAFGLLGLVPGLLGSLGLREGSVWPFVVAALLALADLGYLAHARRPPERAASRGAKANLCAQIVLDLLVLTVVVHFVGSRDTVVAFAYLFHIVLACIFFSRSRSFAVFALAAAFYLACVALEELGPLPHTDIYADASLREHMERTPGVGLLNVGGALVTWAAVWYLASHLSAMVRERDADLGESNRLLLETQQERTQHMLRTTHELKAPFSAIHANVQLLLKGHCGPLPDDAVDVLGRVAARCGRLAAEIQEMLQLANLHSTTQAALPRVELDLADVLRRCMAQIRPMAHEREIDIVEELHPAPVRAVEDHMKMLFANLLANALAYSRRGGRVAVRCAPRDGDGPEVVIQDNGIGIPGDKLPHIFDAYYRTNEAVRHNKESTGLGLAIVSHVAAAHGIRVRVDSKPGVGTLFTLRFPLEPRPHTSQGRAKEGDDGPSHDRG